MFSSANTIHSKIKKRTEALLLTENLKKKQTSKKWIWRYNLVTDCCQPNTRPEFPTPKEGKKKQAVGGWGGRRAIDGISVQFYGRNQS